MDFLSSTKPGPLTSNEKEYLQKELTRDEKEHHLSRWDRRNYCAAIEQNDRKPLFWE